MGKYFDLLLERKEEREKYLENINYYLDLIKERARKILGDDVRIILFGSYLKGNFGPRSDIDILVISKNLAFDENDPFKRARILGQLKKDLMPGLFEFHLVTPEIYENWYKKFIKDNYKEI